jgi:Concanavalin A-like lectin/glucanases superfamily
MKRHFPGLCLLMIMTGTLFAETIHYWRFEEGTGFTAADEVGGLNGSMSGFNEYTGWTSSVALATVPLTGQPNMHSIRFGVGFLNVTTPQAINLGTSFTIEFYFNANQPSSASVFFSLGTPGLSYLLFESDGHIYFDGGFMADNVDSVPSDFLTVGEWHHLALVKQPGQYSLYIDSVLITTQALSPEFDGPYIFPGTSPSSNTRKIGYGFSGYMDEFRISNTALTTNEFLNATYIPEVSALLPAVEVGYATKAGFTYQVQYADEVGSTNWFDLGIPFSGDGSTNYVLQTTRGATNRAYRVILVP